MKARQDWEEGNIILLETLKISFDSSLIKVATALRNDWKFFWQEIVSVNTVFLFYSPFYTLPYKAQPYV